MMCNLTVSRKQQSEVMAVTQDRIERETTIAAPAARVWELLTSAEHLGRWFGDAGAEIDLRPGGALTLTWEEHGTARGVLERVEPERELTWRWTPIYAMRGSEPAEGTSTLVEFFLTERAGATHLRVVESGFASLRCSDEVRDDSFADHSQGWGIKVGQLAEYAGKVPA